jgi:hypothetical protein
MEAARGGTLERAMEVARGGAFERAMEAARGGAFERAMEAARGGALERTMEVARGGALERTMEATRGGAFERAMEALSNQTTFRIAIDSFNSSFDESAFEAEEAFSEVEVAEKIKALEFSDDKKSFLEVFEKLPSFIQAILLFCFIYIILPLLNNIAANILTPSVQELFNDSKQTQKEQINSAKKISSKEYDIYSQNLRFITGNNVRLRLQPITSSQILDELVIGQVVTIIGKKKNWIKVEYMYEDGKILKGWVFTRYTAKFKS